MIAEYECKATLCQQELEKELEYEKTIVNVEIDRRWHDIDEEADAECVKSDATDELHSTEQKRRKETVTGDIKLRFGKKQNKIRIDIYQE